MAHLADNDATVENGLERTLLTEGLEIRFEGPYSGAKAEKRVANRNFSKVNLTKGVYRKTRGLLYESIIGTNFYLSEKHE